MNKHNAMNKKEC